MPTPGNPINVTTSGAVSFNGTVFTGGTLSVPNGGTGATSFTAYSVICGGTTSTASLQNVSGVGTSGQVLTSNGAATLPTWQTPSTSTGFTTINMQVFTNSGTYTPTANMKYIIVECLGGGGSGGGSGSALSAGVGSAGGGAGGYSRRSISSGVVGASQAVTVGAGGAGGAGGAAVGNNGGATTFGGLVAGNGGSAGGFNNANPPAPGSGGSATGGDLNVAGAMGSTSVLNSGGSALSGFGGSSIYGGGGTGVRLATDGHNATGFGAGGGGSTSASGAASNQTGGNGSNGICIVTEYI